ncbi:MAG: NIPSNAP family protein [Pararobbsia sp.]
MIVEMRVYHCVPGQLPRLHQRFTNVTLKMFEKHGIEPIGFWTTYTGPSNQTLTYMLRWPSLAEQETRWRAFSTDPEWLEQRAKSEENGPIVQFIETAFLAPTAYSPMQ